MPTAPAVERTPTGAERLDFVDALRGWAILGVFAAHVSIFCAAQFPHPFDDVIRLGGRGVQLFYVVSAFTLFLSMHRRSHVESAPVRNFFVRRFFRIAPMWHLAIILYLCTDGFGPRFWLGDQPRITAGNIVANLLFVGGWYPYWMNSVVPVGWSVPIEVAFYLTVPSLARRLPNLRSALWLTTMALIASVALNQILSRTQPIASAEIWRQFLFMWLPSQAPVFCAGIVLYFLWRKAEAGEIDADLSRWLLFAAMALMAIACFGGYAFLPGHFVFAIAFVMLALGLSMRTFTPLVNPITRAVGKVSYSFYLTHYAVLHACSIVLNHFYRTSASKPASVSEFAALALAGGIACFLTASVCYRFIEKPGMEIGRRWIAKREAP